MSCTPMFEFDRGELVAVILQYLHTANLPRAASALESEIEQLQIRVPRSDRVPAGLLTTLLHLAMSQAHDIPSTPDEQSTIAEAASTLELPCAVALLERNWRDTTFYLDLQQALITAREKRKAPPVPPPPAGLAKAPAAPHPSMAAVPEPSPRPLPPPPPNMGAFHPAVPGPRPPPGPTPPGNMRPAGVFQPSLAPHAPMPYGSARPNGANMPHRAPPPPPPNSACATPRDMPASARPPAPPAPAPSAGMRAQAPPSRREADRRSGWDDQPKDARRPVEKREPEQDRRSRPDRADGRGDWDWDRDRSRGERPGERGSERDRGEERRAAGRERGVRPAEAAPERGGWSRREGREAATHRSVSPPPRKAPVRDLSPDRRGGGGPRQPSLSREEEQSRGGRQPSKSNLEELPDVERTDEWEGAGEARHDLDGSTKEPRDRRNDEEMPADHRSQGGSESRHEADDDYEMDESSEARDQPSCASGVEEAPLAEDEEVDYGDDDEEEQSFAEPQGLDDLLDDDNLSLNLSDGEADADKADTGTSEARLPLKEKVSTREAGKGDPAVAKGDLEKRRTARDAPPSSRSDDEDRQSRKRPLREEEPEPKRENKEGRDGAPARSRARVAGALSAEREPGEVEPGELEENALKESSDRAMALDRDGRERDRGADRGLERGSDRGGDWDRPRREVDRGASRGGVESKGGGKGGGWNDRAANGKGSVVGKGIGGSRGGGGHWEGEADPRAAPRDDGRERRVGPPPPRGTAPPAPPRRDGKPPPREVARENPREPTGAREPPPRDAPREAPREAPRDTPPPPRQPRADGGRESGWDRPRGEVKRARASEERPPAPPKPPPPQQQQPPPPPPHPHPLPVPPPPAASRGPPQLPSPPPPRGPPAPVVSEPAAGAMASGKGGKGACAPSWETPRESREHAADRGQSLDLREGLTRSRATSNDRLSIPSAQYAKGGEKGAHKGHGKGGSGRTSTGLVAPQPGGRGRGGKGGR